MVGFRQRGFLTIEVDSKRVEAMIKGLSIEIPKGIKLGAKKVAGMYAESYLRQMRIAGIKTWTGRSSGVIARQIPNPTRIGNSFGVVVPSNLIALDSLKQFAGKGGQFGFPVLLKPGRSITRWSITKRGIGRGLIWVKRHPWLTEANRKARKRVKEIVQRELDKNIRAKGRR